MLKQCLHIGLTFLLGWFVWNQELSWKLFFLFFQENKKKVFISKESKKADRFEPIKIKCLFFFLFICVKNKYKLLSQTKQKRILCIWCAKKKVNEDHQILKSSDNNKEEKMMISVFSEKKEDYYYEIMLEW